MCVGGTVRADVRWSGEDNLGLSARQSFQPWSCWTFPGGAHLGPGHCALGQTLAIRVPSGVCLGLPAPLRA